MRILILGGTGFVGSRLFSFLRSKSYDVNTLDLECYGNYVNTKNLKHNIQELDFSILDEYDCVINLAANAGVKTSETSLVNIFDNNIIPLIKMIPYLKDKLYIHASTGSVYGSNFRGEASETTKLDYSLNNYDLYKKICDDILLSSDLHNFYSLRFGTVCGGSENFRTDVMINAMYDSYLNEGIVRVFGGSTRRPVLGILDLCKAVDTIILSDDKKSGIYNVSSFNSTSFEIATEVSNYLRCPLLDLDDPSVATINCKLQTTQYDYFLNVDKFVNAFDFKFNESVESIVRDIERYSIMYRGNRADPLEV